MADTPVGDVLECTICLDIPASPIHNCVNGHIVCGICRDYIITCGICTGQLAVSALAERVSRQLDFKSKCPNYESGCRGQIPSTDIMQHMYKCYYRNALCCEKTNKVCNFKPVPLAAFVEHLQEQHECQFFSDSWFWTPRNIIVERQFTNQLADGFCWPLVIAARGGRSYLMHGSLRKDVVYFWVTVLSSRHVAEGLMCEVSLKAGPECRKANCSWTLPVYAYHDYPRLKDPPTRLLTSIPVQILKEYSSQEVVDGIINYSFSMSYRII